MWWYIFCKKEGKKRWSKAGRRGGDGAETRIKMCCAHVLTPHKECNHCGLQVSTNKIIIKILIELSIVQFLKRSLTIFYYFQRKPREILVFIGTIIRATEFKLSPLCSPCVHKHQEQCLWWVPVFPCPQPPSVSINAWWWVIFREDAASWD